MAVLTRERPGVLSARAGFAFSSASLRWHPRLDSAARCVTLLLLLTL